METLEAHGAVGKQLHFQADADGEQTLELVFSRENLHGEAALRRALGDPSGGCHFQDGLSAVSAIGAGINASYRNLLAGGAALRAAGIAVAGLSTSSFRITWLVPRERLDEAVRRLHAAYLEAGACSQHPPG